MFKPEKSSHFVKVTACFIWSHVAVSSRRESERGTKSENETRHSAREIFILSRGRWLSVCVVRAIRKTTGRFSMKNRRQVVGERNHSDWLFSAEKTNGKRKRKLLESVPVRSMMSSIKCFFLHLFTKDIYNFLSETFLIMSSEINERGVKCAALTTC